MTGATADVLNVCELAVMRALELAAKRTRNANREVRGLLDSSGIPSHEWHTVMTVRPGDAAESYLAPVWAQLTIVLANDAHPFPERVAVVCDGYVRALLQSGSPIDRDDLTKYLELAYES